MVCPTSGLKPAVEAKESVKTTSTAAHCGNGTQDKNRSSTMLEEIKKVKIRLGQLGLLKGCVTGSHVDYDSLKGVRE